VHGNVLQAQLSTVTAASGANQYEAAAACKVHQYVHERTQRFPRTILAKMSGGNADKLSDASLDQA
jgi:hypothetical protein